jgi:hypothetical protein
MHMHSCSAVRHSPRQPATANKRCSPRPPALMKALILAPGQQSPAPCLVRDVSKGGVKLEVNKDGDIPSIFWLQIEGEPGLRSCAVIWHKAVQLGVSFTQSREKPPLLGRVHFDARSWLGHRMTARA